MSDLTDFAKLIETHPDTPFEPAVLLKLMVCQEQRIEELECKASTHRHHTNMHGLTGEPQ